MRFRQSIISMPMLLIFVFMSVTAVYAGGADRANVEFKGHGKCAKLTDRFTVKLILWYDDQLLMNKIYHNTDQLQNVTAYDAKVDGNLAVNVNVFDRMWPSIIPIKKKTWKHEPFPQGRYQFHLEDNPNAQHPGEWEFNLDMVRVGNTVDMYCE